MNIYLLRHTESFGNIVRKARNAVDGYDEMRSYVVDSFTKPEIADGIQQQDWPSPRMKKIATRVRQVVDSLTHPASDAECDLSPDGVEQAHCLGQKLSEHLPDRIDTIFYSPYLRTMRTKDIITERFSALQKATHITDTRLREKHAGAVKKDYISYFIQHPSEFLKAQKSDQHYYHGYQPPHGENSEQLLARVKPFVNELLTKHQGQNVMVVAHKISLLAIMAHFEKQTTTRHFQRFDSSANALDNGGLATYHVGQHRQIGRKQHEQVLY